MTDEQLKDVFTYHPPTEKQREIYEQINAAFLECARVVNAVTPEGPGKTVAIRKLSDARMQANASVALEGRF
jgi:hypothetical protein